MKKKEVTRVERDKGTQWGASNFRSVTRTQEKLKTFLKGLRQFHLLGLLNNYPGEELHAGHALIDILLIKKILGEDCLDRQRNRMPKRRRGLSRERNSEC